MAAGRELCLGLWLLCQRHWVLSLSASFPGQVGLPGPWLQADSPDLVSVLRGACPAHLPEEPHSLHLPVRGLHPRGLRTLFCIRVRTIYASLAQRCIFGSVCLHPISHSC